MVLQKVLEKYLVSGNISVRSGSNLEDTKNVKAEALSRVFPSRFENKGPREI